MRHEGGARGWIPLVERVQTDSLSALAAHCVFPPGDNVGPSHRVCEPPRNGLARELSDDDATLHAASASSSGWVWMSATAADPSFMMRGLSQSRFEIRVTKARSVMSANRSVVRHTRRLMDSAICSAASAWRYRSDRRLSR